jgi:hypothetical protein
LPELVHRDGEDFERVEELRGGVESQQGTAKEGGRRGGTNVAKEEEVPSDGDTDDAATGQGQCGSRGAVLIGTDELCGRRKGQHMKTGGKRRRTREIRTNRDDIKRNTLIVSWHQTRMLLLIRIPVRTVRILGLRRARAPIRSAAGSTRFRFRGRRDGRTGGLVSRGCWVEGLRVEFRWGGENDEGKKQALVSSTEGKKPEESAGTYESQVTRSQHS